MCTRAETSGHALSVPPSDRVYSNAPSPMSNSRTKPSSQPTASLSSLPLTAADHTAPPSESREVCTQGHAQAVMYSLSHPHTSTHTSNTAHTHKHTHACTNTNNNDNNKSATANLRLQLGEVEFGDTAVEARAEQAAGLRPREAVHGGVRLARVPLRNRDG